MSTSALSPEQAKAAEQVLGYLNFSAGAADPAMLEALNRLFRLADPNPADVQDPAAQNPSLHKQVLDQLQKHLEQLATSNSAFADSQQATRVLELVSDHVLPGYRQFHSDLLFHQTDAALFNSFFLGRACEATLQEGLSEEEPERAVANTLRRLNDYIGHRPVATLESQKIQPYPHEFVRPVPLFVRDAGVAEGRYRAVVEGALALLADVDPDLLESSYFELERLDELAFDPRAFDFDHPVNKRPNYHFGQWDPHQIDNRGQYRRYVVQQVTLDALMDRLENPPDLPPDELLFEAAAVLAGTILMASGISGRGPDTHDSSVTLSGLLPQIAAYRDTFYERLFERAEGEHAKRLQQEAEERRQPFGGARQHLNAQLARRRASQMEHVHLARLFARMGHTEAAKRQVDFVRVPSARMQCQINCWLAEAHQEVVRGNLQAAAELPPRVVDLMQRAVECGALMDPWNILGFDGHFSLFPALENSVVDHRVEELVELVETLFTMYSRLWSEAAAVDNQELCAQSAEQFREVSQWWGRFAAHEVMGIGAVDPTESFRAAEHVAHCLNLWHRGGAAVGDVKFWAPHAQRFQSPQAYGLVIDALLNRSDFVGSMGLLVHWMSQVDQVPLEQGESSFFRLSERWVLDLQNAARTDDPTKDPIDAWSLARKFLDYIEANADAFWEVPQFDLGGKPPPRTGEEPILEGGDENDEDDNLYGAAYEDVVYRDSTDDGVEGQIFEPGANSLDALGNENDRLASRLNFLNSVAGLWRMVAVTPESPERADAPPPDREVALRRWGEQASRNLARLLELMEHVLRFPIPSPGGDHDSMVEYDRVRLTKESLLERIIATCVESADAARLLVAALQARTSELVPSDWAECLGLEQEETALAATYAALLRQDVDGVREVWSDLIEALGDQPLLYVPLSKGGNPSKIVAARVRQQGIQNLLTWLPRLGLIVETCHLVETSREMERNNPVGPGAVTEFDELYKMGYKSTVECLVHSAKSWAEQGELLDDEDSVDSVLVGYLEQLTESQLVSWLAHSRTLRLSVLEKVHDERKWERLVEFIETYGGELFTQRFLNLGNVRAILHQGVDEWLQLLEKEAYGESVMRLLDDLGGQLSRKAAVHHLSLVLEAIIENYGEYRDYNSTTTQSDRGELLYTLLDFLRLRTKYDRICWNLKPVVLAHEILVRNGMEEAARLWRRSLTERIAEEADTYLKRLRKLQKKYAMQMPTVADRLAERFVRPMAIDRMRALVQPAIDEAERQGPCPVFELLEHETEVLTREPTGVGLDVPTWLLALEEEVERHRQPWTDDEIDRRFRQVVPMRAIPRAEAQEQLDEWSRKQ